MGKRGIRAKPTELKKLQGVKPSRINENEPKAPKGLPNPPSHLDAIGIETWHRIGLLLEGMGILQHSDAEALALYCIAYSRYVRAEHKLKVEGEVIETSTTVKKNPWIEVSNESYKQMMKILIEFGFTPSARSGIKVVEDLENDPLVQFMREGL